MVDILVQAGAWPPQDVLAETARCAIEAVALVDRKSDQTGLPDNDRDGEISIVFTDDAAIRVLNERWRGQDKATNVLSFAQDGPGLEAGMLGDIVLAQETVAREAALEGKLLNHHIAHMIVHGFLHLLGYDHQNDIDAKTMEDLERKALKQIGIADPYACAGTKDD
jgi:probable rRNA maturation factor